MFLSQKSLLALLLLSPFFAHAMNRQPIKASCSITIPHRIVFAQQIDKTGIDISKNLLGNVQINKAVQQNKLMISLTIIPKKGSPNSIKRTVFVPYDLLIDTKKGFNYSCF
jgi:hypothetical protein